MKLDEADPAEPDGDDMAEGGDYDADLEAEMAKFDAATDVKERARIFRAMQALCGEKG